MNAYFTIVLLGVGLFFLMWALGWFLERLSHRELQTTRAHGSRAWYLLVGPGVALHEFSHWLGCKFTGTEVVEFKPINVSYEGDHVILGYVKYRKPNSELKNSVINLAPVAVSLVLLILFAVCVSYLIPDSGIGGKALVLFDTLINAKALDPTIPLFAIGGFLYEFFDTLSSLTVVNPLFWIIAYLAMTIMFSNAPSDVDIQNARTGLKAIIIFDLIWLIVAFVLPAAGWLLWGLFELLAVMFALGVAFAAVGYGFFIMITAMSRLKLPFNILPFIACVATGGILLYYAYEFQTIISLGVFVLVFLLLYAVRGFRKGPV